jgi:hypothetical protein
MPSMRRHLDVVPRLFRRPCPLDSFELPRVDGGFDCARCGRTVVDVATLTIDEVVQQRRRARAGGDRVCHAYTLDDEDRVLLRAAHGPSVVVAVAVGALLAACEVTVDGEPAQDFVPRANVAIPAPAGAASGKPPTPEVATAVAMPALVASSQPASDGTTPAKRAALDGMKSPEPPCLGLKSPSAKPKWRKRRNVMGGI